MPRKFRSRRKKGYRRAGRLSKTRILTRTSAKSQALQINALNRKVNRVYRKCRPEFKSYFISPAQHIFSNQIIGSTSQVYISFPIVRSDLLTPGATNHNRIGDYVYILSSYLDFTLEYYNNTGQMMHDTEPLGGSIRFIILRVKGNVPNIDLAPLNILSHYAASGANYELNTVTPLKTGITETFSILADKTFTLTPYRSHVYGRIKFRGGSFRTSEGSTVGVGKGAIYCFVVTSGLHYDDNMKEYIQLSYSAKVPFRDN